MSLAGKSLLFVVSEDWYFLSHRLPIARAAQNAGARVGVACRVAEQGDKIKAEGFDLYPLSIARSGRNPLADLKLVWNLAALFKRVKPDIIHNVAMKPVLYGSLAAWLTSHKVPAVVNAMAGLGFVFISNGLFARFLRPPIKALFKTLMNRRNTILIVQNPDDETLFQKRVSVRPDKITLIRGSGVDTDQFSPVERFEEKPVIRVVCVSRMLWDKGIGELVGAARLLKERKVPVTVQLVGPSDENPASIPKAQLDAWRKEGLVEVLGPSNAIQEVNAKADIAVLPSYREGLPKTLLEAAACGLPIVATDVPGCREICREGVTGLLVPPHSVEPLADALQKLAEDPALRQRMGERARRAAVEEFSISIVQSETLALYKKLLEEN